MNTTTPSGREPDELDDLAECAKVVFSVLDALCGPEAMARDVSIAEQRLAWLEEVAERRRNLCQKPARCEQYRCRRRQRCVKLDGLNARLAAERADVAAQRARLVSPPPVEPVPSALQPR